MSKFIIIGWSGPALTTPRYYMEEEKFSYSRKEANKLSKEDAETLLTNFKSKFKSWNFSIVPAKRKQFKTPSHE